MTTLARIGFEADTSGLKKAQSELDNTARHGQSAEKKLDRSIDNTNKNFKSLRSSIGLVSTALIALGGAASTRELIKYSDSWKGINSQIRQVTESEKELLAVRELVVKTAKETRSDLEATTKLYTALDRATTHLGVSTEKQIELTKTINNLFLSGGKSAEEASGAIRQLTQGLESGALRGDEFNSVAENAPRILDALAASTGKARGELREFAATGGITAEILVKALSDYNEEAQKLADQTEKTFGQSMEIATTNMTEFVGELDSVNSVIGGLGSGLESLSANMDALSSAVGAGATVLGLSLLPPLYKTILAQKEAVVASIASAKAAESAAAASVKQAAAEKALSASKVLGLKDTLAAINSELALESVRMKAQISDIGRIQSSTRFAEISAARLAITNQLTAAEARAATAATAMGIAQDKLASSAAKATIATNALGVATKFLLGPWGLVITAVGIAATTYYSAKDAVVDLDKAQKDLNKTLTESETILGRFQKAQDALLLSGLKLADMSKNRLQEEFDKASKKLELYQNRLERLKDNKASQARIIELTKKIREQQIVIDAIAKKIPNASTTYDKLSGSMKKLADRLDPLTAAQNKLVKDQETLTSAQEKGIITAKEYATFSGLLSAEFDKTWNSTERLITPFEKMFMALHDQRQQLTMTSDEYEIYRLRLDAIANGVAPEMIEVLVKEKKALQELEKTLDKTGEKTDEWGDITERAADRIDQAFADVWVNIFDGFESVTDGLINSFKRMLAEMAHAAITKPIVLQITSALGLGGAGALSGGMGGALGGLLGLGGILGGSQAGGALGGIGSLAGGLTAAGGLGLFGNSMFGLSMGSTTGLLAAGEFGSAFSTVGGLLGGGELLAGLGAALPIISAIAGIAGIADSLTGGGLFGTSYKATGQDLTLGTSGGDVTGFTTLTEKKKRSLFRGSKTRTTDTAFDTSAIEDIFTNLEFAIVDAAEMLDISDVTETIVTRLPNKIARDLGLDNDILDALTSTVTMPVEEWLDNFSARLKIDTEGLSEEEIQAQINAWVQKTTDAMITGVFGDFLGDVRKEGETSADALNRVIINMELFSGISEALGLNFELTGKEAAIASTNIAELAGGIDNLAALSNQYYNSFFSEQEKFDKLTNDLNGAFGELNVSMPQTREGFRVLVESLDLTSQQGQEMFATLMQLVPSMDAYLTELEKQNGGIISMTDTLSDAMSEIERAVDAERLLASARLSTAQATYDAQVSAIDQQKTLLDSQHSVLTDNLSFAEQQLREAFNVEKAGIQEASQARISGLNAEKSVINASISKLKSIADKFSSSGSNVSVQDALDAARRGNFALAEQLSVSNVSDSGFGSAQEMAFAQARQNTQLREIGGLAGSRASAQQSMLASLDRQISLTQSNAAEQISKLDEQLAALLGIDTAVPSLEEAIVLYGQAQQDLDELNYDAQLEGLNEQLALAEETLALAQKEYDDEMTRLDGILEDSKKQIEVMLEIDSSIMSVEEAVNNLASTMEELNNRAISSNTPVVPIEVTTPNMGSKGIAMQEETAAAIQASTRANAETADILQKIYRGEITVRVAT